MVFTDGSCHDGKVGAAATVFVNHEHVATMRYHLGKATDSTVPGHYLLIRFRKLIRHVLDRRDINDSEISLTHWVAGHADILGNELADKEARRVATSESKTSPKRTLPSALRIGPPNSLSATKQYHEANLQRIWTES